ncbi:MAG: DUF1858 domain-containing protein, partial [Peptoniphilaceae bacterium]|nr:DUF1858 domain-containing protein [Peptoniphilaceae bacterium]MDY5765362.1 DUF1858 domain-containing protein [Peptoniphilaceae bacterium]
MDLFKNLHKSETTDDAQQAGDANPVIITKDMLISEVIQKKPRTIQTLMVIGMGCIGCPSSLMET